MKLIARHYKGPVREESFDGEDLLTPFMNESLAEAFENVLVPGITENQKDEIYEAFLTAIDDSQASHLLPVMDYEANEDCPVGYIYYQILPENEDDEDYIANFDGVGDDLEATFEAECGQQLKASDFGFRPSKHAPTFDPQALALVNKHRTKLGMAPIDPRAGWTAAEIAQMAENIRKTGRMANPKILPLVEIHRRAK